MRFGGPPKRRRDAAAGAARMPPLWPPTSGRPTHGNHLWPPRYPPLGSPFYMPYMGAPPPEPPSLSAAASAQARKDKAKIVQFEWNGCTFYRYIPDKMSAGRLMGTPGEPPAHQPPPPPPPPPQPFGRPRSYEWHQRPSRSQSRRRKQVYPPRAAPPWTPGPTLPTERPAGGATAASSSSSKQYGAASNMAAAAAMGASGGVPFRTRENPRIPRKESKPTASHVHLPSFLATPSSKPGATAKTPSPPTATHVQGPPRAAAFRNSPLSAVAPLPFPLRAAFGAEESGASPSLPKRAEHQMTASTSQGKSKASGGMTIRRSQDASVPESEALGAKPKKPQRMNNMTFNKSSTERSGGNSVYNSSSNSNNKTFTRAPPFRNSPRVYSSTVLKDFNHGSKQDARSAAGNGNKPVLSAPKESPPKEQRAARQDRRVRYKAEIVGSNIIVTRQENSPDKKLDGTAMTAQNTGRKSSTPPKASNGNGDKKKAGEGPPATSNRHVDTAKVGAACWKDGEGSAFQSRILHAALLHGANLADVGRSSATADAFTQLTDFEVNEQFDRFLSPGQSSITQGKPESKTDLKSPSEDEWPDPKFRNVSVQTADLEATLSDTGKLEEDKPEAKMKYEEQVEELQVNSVIEPEKQAKIEVNGLPEPLSEGEQEPSPLSYAEEQPTSSSEIYLDSLVSNGTSTSSPRDDAYRKSSYATEKNLNPECPLARLEELDAFLEECSPIKGAPQNVQEPQTAPRSCVLSSTTPSDAISRGTSAESASPHASSSQESSSLSRGDGFSDISEPRSPLAKDLQVPDNTSLASDVILINFAEDTTTLKEHLDGLVADYKAKQEIDATSSVGTALCPDVSSIDGANNILEKHAGSSPTRSSAPVLQPSDVSPQNTLKIASEETRTAGGDFGTSSAAKEMPQDKIRAANTLTEKGDSSSVKFPSSGSGVISGEGRSSYGAFSTVENGGHRSLASCDSCGVYCTTTGSMNSESFARLCSCKTHQGARAKCTRPPISAHIDEALKEEYRDPEIVPCFVEESVEYLLRSEDEEYEEVMKRREAGRNAGQEGSRGRCTAGGDERPTASQRYPENSRSWNKIKAGSEASALVAATEQCCSDITTAAASRALIYDCPWWSYDQGSNDSKGASNTALASCGQASGTSVTVAAATEIASNAAAVLHPWSTTLRAAAAAAETGVPSAQGPASFGASAAPIENSNPWAPFLATAQSFVGPKKEAAMSSGDHDSADEVARQLARSDTDFTALYMEGQPRRPSLKQRWPAATEGDSTGTTAAAATAGQQQRRTSGGGAGAGCDRDSLSFYEFPMNEQHEALPPQQHSLSMETLVGSNRLDARSTASTGVGERRLAEGEPMPPPEEVTGLKGSQAAQSPSAQYCELELYAPVIKSGPALCAVVVPPHSLAEGDGARGGEVLIEAVPGSVAPSEDSSCADKKAAEGSAKPAGKIRNRFRDLFWKHK